MDKIRTKSLKVICSIALAGAFIPTAAFASTSVFEETASEVSDSVADSAAASTSLSVDEVIVRAASAQEAAWQVEADNSRESGAVTKTLAYDQALLDEVGTQEESGHSICCPSFSCAYADTIIDGTVNDHDYYGCSCCVWTDWGGGDSAFRDLGSDEALLREAYDQIAAGKPVVTHMSASYGEHWIVLIGYHDAEDPDHLTLDNFVAIDPWDGSVINASDGFELYGDNCQHVSDR